MNENDLRDCFAMFITAGAVMRGEHINPYEVWDMADRMLVARNKPKEKDDEEDTGIARVAKRTYKRKS